MQLERKPDFDKTLARFEAWWHCEIIDRPPASLNVKNDAYVNWPPKRKYATLRDRWFDIEGGVLGAKACAEGGIYAGDSFPMFLPNIGPELCSTVFGCELEFGEYTSWSKPTCENIRGVLKLKPNLDNPYWNAIRKATDLSLEMGKGKWITAMPDMHTNGDLLAALRDPQNLAMDMLDDPEGVRLACEHVTGFYQTMYDDMYRRIKAAGQPCTTWINCLHDGKINTSQCDFICMISPDSFQRAILPSIARENECLDRSIFHLDGPGAVKHLDALLERGNFDGIQWVRTAGSEPARKWIGLFKKVQNAGKCQQLICDDINDAKALAEHIKPQGAWFCPGGAYTIEEANDFLKWVERWAAGSKA